MSLKTAVPVDAAQHWTDLKQNSSCCNAASFAASASNREIAAIGENMNMKMYTDSSSTKTKAENTEATYYPGAYATLFSKGLVRVVEVSKTTLDLAVEQNTEVLASYKKVLRESSMPGLFLFDLAGQAFEGYVTLQKALLDLAVGQSTAVAKGVEEYIHDPSEANAVIAKVIRQSVDHMDAAQKSVLDFEAKETKAVSDTVKQQPDVDRKHAETVAHTLQHGVDSLHATQKETLDNASKHLKTAAGKA
jgi:hypothetical protein